MPKKAKKTENKPESVEEETLLSERDRIIQGEINNLLSWRLLINKDDCFPFFMSFSL